jgi:hypothetical protein
MTELNIDSINYFTVSNRNENDSSNKIRESIIEKIINKKIPNEYYENKKWYELRNAILTYIKNLQDYENIECIPKGGRQFNYDFEFKCFNPKLTTYNIEFKFNFSSIKELPQFVSPIKPSQYMSLSYEEYFYDNYLPILASVTKFEIPEKKIYLNNIHTNKPECMKKYQNLYYQGCKRSSQFTGEERAIEFYKLSLEMTKESIKNFIQLVDLDIEKLSSYLKNSQNNKIYMLYKDGTFYRQDNVNDYSIIEYQKTKNQFICKTINNKIIKVLLRWKNGNGIAFPAFQIS